MISINSIKSLLIKSTKVVVLVFTIVIPIACSLQVDKAPLISDKQLLEVRNANTDLFVQLDDNQRFVNLSVSYPLGNGQYPLIIFSHGNSLDNQSYRNLTDYWVERGFVVVAPLHLDSDGDMAAIAEQYGHDWVVASRLIELSAVIDHIAEIVLTLEGFNGTVLTDRVIAAGHSFGALSSQQLSGAKIEMRNDSIYSIPDSLIDDRVIAVVAVSPPGLIQGFLTEATWQGFSTPQLVVTGPNDFFPFIWPDYEDHFVSYLTADQGNNYLLVLDEMDHYLGNLIGRLERDSPSQILALKNLSEISMLFIEQYLSEAGQTKLLADKISNSDGVLRFEQR